MAPLPGPLTRSEDFNDRFDSTWETDDSTAFAHVELPPLAKAYGMW
jgi:hypothetical protein